MLNEPLKTRNFSRVTWSGTGRAAQKIQDAAYARLMLFQGVHPAQQAGPPPLGQRKEPSACRASRLLRAVQQAVVFHLFQQAVDPGRVGRVALKLGHGLQPLEQQVTVQRAISQQAKQNGVNKAGQVAPGTGAFCWPYANNIWKKPKGL